MSRLALALAFQVLLGVKGEAPCLYAYYTTGEVSTLERGIEGRVKRYVFVRAAPLVRWARLIETFYFP